MGSFGNAKEWVALTVLSLSLIALALEVVHRCVWWGGRGARETGRERGHHAGCAGTRGGGGCTGGERLPRCKIPRFFPVVLVLFSSPPPPPYC